MSLSFLAPTRTVLLISDESLFIYSIGPKGVKLVESVPWNVDNFEANVATVISKECGGKPILILNDMVEQHYRKEKIPKVGALDKSNVVQRKLMVSFPNYPVRAALALKEKISKGDKKASGGSLYIFAAIPDSDAFKKTMGAARRSLAPIAGFCLLPVEASDMITTLGKKLSKGKEKAEWTVFIGQHQSGGLRQVVVRNGELALTRMTPIIENDDDPERWVKEINQEFKATMSYLTRFGFDPSHGLNIILIANSAAGDMMQELIEVKCNFYAISPSEAATTLGIPIPRTAGSHLADVLHVGWIGRKTSFILPMKAKEIEKVSQPRQIAVIASFLLLLGAAFQGYQLFGYYQNVSANQEDIDSETSKKAQLELQLAKEVKRKEDLGFDITLIQSALAVNNKLEEERIKILQILYFIGVALGTDMRIDHIEVKKGEPKILDSFSAESPKTPSFEATMQMTFPSTTDPIKGNQEVQDLQIRLQTIMPDHVVKVTKKLEDYEYSEAIVVQTGDAAKDVASQDFVAEIKIEGPGK